MRKLLLFGLLVPVLVGAASADLYNWQVKIGLGDNLYPYGNDVASRFGVAKDGTWDYDGRDYPHPPPQEPAHDLGWIYSDEYWRVYEYEVLHDAGPFHWDEPVGWPPPWKDGGGGGYYPDYPTWGLLKDLREPILGLGQPEIWWVNAYAPNKGATCTLKWTWNMDPDLLVPRNMQVQIWGNSDLEAVGIYGDVILNRYGDGRHEIPGIPQWGLNDEGNPIKHRWIIQATLIPEPSMAQLAGLLMGMVGIGFMRRRT
jgi:hypothetical protein